MQLTPLSHQLLIQRNVTIISYWQILTRYRNSFDPTFRGWAWPESMAFSTGDAAHKTPRWAGTVSEVSSPAKEVAQGAMVKTWNIPWTYIYIYIYVYIYICMGKSMGQIYIYYICMYMRIPTMRIPILQGITNTINTQLSMILCGPSSLMGSLKRPPQKDDWLIQLTTHLEIS